jgi:hypothetical protein
VSTTTDIHSKLIQPGFHCKPGTDRVSINEEAINDAIFSGGPEVPFSCLKVAEGRRSKA